MKIRAHMALIASAVLIPVMAFSTIAIELLLEAERNTAFRNLHETARATALIIDHELESAEAALRVLSMSPTLANGDLPNFYKQARSADRGSAAAWTVLFNQYGQQLMNTALPFDGRISAAMPIEPLHQVLQTQRTTVSDLIREPVSKRYVTSVNVPVPIDRGQHYILAEIFAANYFTRAFTQGRMPAEWTVAVIDRNGNFIARNRKSDELVGTSARPELIKAASYADEGQLRHLTWEGVDSYDVFTHSKLSGWTIAVAAPANLIDQAARRAVLVAVLGLLAATICAIGAGALVSRRLVLAIRDAGQSATALGRGEVRVVESTGVNEIDELNSAINKAGGLLAQEQKSRQLAEIERERLLENEQLARRHAERQNQAKDQFLAMLGHELRNPLSAISGAAAVIKAGDYTQRYTEPAQAIIERQSRHLSKILDDLLDLSRMTMGKITLNRQRLDLGALVSTCVDALRASNRASAYAIRLDTQQAWIYADQTRIEQIIDNLTGNALKFTPAGGSIDIAVRIFQPHAVLTVRDNGMGISADLLPHIFDAFVQGAAQSDRSKGGLGIGLNLVRQLVKLHGGEIDVHSKGPDTGTTVVVRFALVDHDLESVGVGNAPTRLEAKTAGEILLIEDNVDARVMMRDVLELAGCTVLEAGNGADGIALASSALPEIAIVDIGLPDMDGYEVARTLRNLPATATMRLIALTGYGQPADRQLALDSGFDLHMVKPVNMQALLDVLRVAPSAEV